MTSDSGKTAFGLLMLAVVLLASLTAVRVYPQVAGATLSGTVTDPSGAVIPNTKISIKNTSTGVTRDVTADRAGFYGAPNLLTGPYRVTVSASGFSTQVQSGVALTVGANQVLNVTMQLGKVTNLVQVTGAAPMVQLASSNISAVVNSTTVRQLPLNGRSWSDLAKLQPGVDAIQTQPNFQVGADRGNRGFGAQLTVSGARPQQNNYRLDGISINDYSNGAPGSVLGGNLGVDAIQEFSVITSNYSAEYGRTSGGIINAITRSGTNSFHGAAYEFLRNSTLDARNFFDVGGVPPFRRNQFGGDAGGPIQKDKTFIFGDYEGIRQSQGITNVNTVPSLAARNGNLCSIPGTPPICVPTTITVDPSAQKYLIFFPAPNGPVLGNGDVGIFDFVGQQVISENFFTARVDHTFSERDSMFANYVYDDTPYQNPSSLDQALFGAHTNRQTAVLEENHIFSPSLVNSVRLGFNRNGVSNNKTLSAINPAAADPALGAIPGANAAQLRVSGLTSFTGGLNSASTFDFYWNSFQVYDDAFLTRGSHSLKFGGVVERMQLNMIALSNPGGQFKIGSLKAFLTNQPSRFDTGLASSISPRGFRQTLFGAYFLDDWRWHPSLTLNLGLRYEMTTVPTEVQNKSAQLLKITDPTPHLGSPIFSNPTLRNFEPRIGFAWDPFHNGKTAVRGGFELFDSLPLPYEIMLEDSESAPFFATGSATKLPAGSFYAGVFPLLKATSARAGYFQPNPPRAYIMQWNFNVQRQLTPSLTASAGYVGSRGVHQPFRAEDINLVIPQSTPAGYLWPSPVGSGTIINPNFGEIVGLMFNETTSYDALEVSIQKRMSHGLQLQGSYTWGKGMDDGSATEVGDQFGNSMSCLRWFDPRLNRGVTDFNVGRTLILNATWEVPTPESWKGFRQLALGGWQVGGIFTASDGVPFTATFGSDGDPLGLNSTDPKTVPNRLVGSGCSTLVNPGNPNNYIKTQCFAVPTAPSAAFYAANCDPTLGSFPQCFNLRGNAGRNILTSPGLADFDFSLFKNIPVRRVSENFNIQFRAEFFDILNRANFAPPVNPDNTDIFDSTGAPTGVAGLLTSTTTSPREIQFALKVIW